jgi:hypothetical protein
MIASGRVLGLSEIADERLRIGLCGGLGSMADMKDIGINNDLLFDTDAFEEWAEDRSVFSPVFERWEKSPFSNSYYADVTAWVGTDDEPIEVNFKLRVSDHVAWQSGGVDLARGTDRGATVPVDLDYLEMPLSETMVDGYREPWKPEGGVTWNLEQNWKEILKAVDNYCRECCPICGLHQQGGVSDGAPCPSCEEELD